MHPWSSKPIFPAAVVWQRAQVEIALQKHHHRHHFRPGLDKHLATMVRFGGDTQAAPSLGAATGCWPHVDEAKLLDGGNRSSAKRADSRRTIRNQVKEGGLWSSIVVVVFIA